MDATLGHHVAAHLSSLHVLAAGGYLALASIEINQQNNLKDAHNFRPNGKIKTKLNLNSQAQINKNKRATVDTAARFWSDKISVSHRGRSGFVVGALLFPCVSFLSHTMRGPCVRVYIDWEWNALCAPLHLILHIFCPDSHRMHPAEQLLPLGGVVVHVLLSHQRPFLSHPSLFLYAMAAAAGLEKCMHALCSGRDNNRIFFDRRWRARASRMLMGSFCSRALKIFSPLRKLRPTRQRAGKHLQGKTRQVAAPGVLPPRCIIMSHLNTCTFYCSFSSLKKHLARTHLRGTSLRLARWCRRDCEHMPFVTELDSFSPFSIPFGKKWQLGYFWEKVWLFECGS